MSADEDEISLDDGGFDDAIASRCAACTGLILVLAKVANEDLLKAGLELLQTVRLSIKRAPAELKSIDGGKRE